MGRWRMRRSCSLFLEELFVEKENEQVDVDLGLVKHLHHGHALVLQLQEVLVLEQELLHLHTEEPSLDSEAAPLWPGNDVKHHVLEPAV